MRFLIFVIIVVALLIILGIKNSLGSITIGLAILGALAGELINMFVGGLIGTMLPQEICYTEEFDIVSLNTEDNQCVYVWRQGDTYRCICINDKTKFDVRQISSNRVEFYTEDNKPFIKIVHYRYKENWYYIFASVVGLKYDTVEIYIPENCVLL